MESVAMAATTNIAAQTTNFMNWIKQILTWDHIFKLITVGIIIFVLWIVYKLVIRGIKKLPVAKMSGQRQMIIQKLIKYVFYFLVVMNLLSLFGVKLSAVWGAAGIAGVAIGFAAQTSVSNIISGVFVLTEGALKVGDTIIVDGITGIVDSVNLLSVQVHTFDNQMVRIPNSTIINSNLINNSYHDSRRYTLTVDVGYDTDLQKALDVLKQVPSMCPTVLAEPESNAWIDGFGESGIHITVAVWFKPEDFVATKNAVFIAVKKVFDEAGIEIPFNQLDVHFDGEEKVKV